MSSTKSAHQKEDVRSAPTFASAGSLAEKACTAWLDPAYWYPVEWDAALGKEKVIGVKFGDISVALYRGRDGRLSAIEDRCAHRRVKLSEGFVEGCNLKCVYHGWTYKTDGRLAAIPYDLCGKSFPSIKLRTFPVESRYGLIWVFFGDPALAEVRRLPEIPELDGNQQWHCLELDLLWRAHPTMIINNFMDSTHVETVHSRRFQTRTLKIGPIVGCRQEGDRVTVSYEIEMEPNGLLRYIGSPLVTGNQDNHYEYPYLHACSGGIYQLWAFMLPRNDGTTRVFFLSLSKEMKIPFTPWPIPRWLQKAFSAFARRSFIEPLFAGDVRVAEMEQRAYDEHFDAHCVEPHPAPNLCYRLTVRKWNEHLSRQEP